MSRHFTIDRKNLHSSQLLGRFANLIPRAFISDGKKKKVLAFKSIIHAMKKRKEALGTRLGFSHEKNISVGRLI